MIPQLHKPLLQKFQLQIESRFSPSLANCTSPTVPDFRAPAKVSQVGQGSIFLSQILITSFKQLSESFVLLSLMVSSSSTPDYSQASLPRPHLWERKGEISSNQAEMSTQKSFVLNVDAHFTKVWEFLYPVRRKWYNIGLKLGIAQTRNLFTACM